MAGKRVLEIEQPEMRDAVAAFDQHDVLGVIIAQHRDRPKPVAGNRLEHLRATPPDSFRIDLGADGRAIPFGEQLELLEPLLEPVRLEPGHRRMAVEVDQHVGRELVQLALALRVVVERLAQPRAAEIAEQQQARIEVAREDFRRAEAASDRAIRRRR